MMNDTIAGRSPRPLDGSISELGESPVWDERRQALFWCDILGRKVHWYVPETGLRQKHAFPDKVGCIGLCESGKLVVACGLDVLLFCPDSRDVRKLGAIPNPSGEPCRSNDGRIGPDGAFWIGTMHDVPLSEMQPLAALWRVTVEGAEVIQEGLTCANGLAFSRDGSEMWHSDSVQKWVRRREFDPATGRYGEGEILCRPTAETGRPDGGALDVAATYWSAGVSAGVINAYDRTGATVETIPLPVPHPTMPCFGGPDFKTLFVTTHRQKLSDEQLERHSWSGMVLSVEMDTPGFPPFRFPL